LAHDNQLERDRYLLRSIEILRDQEVVIVNAMPLPPHDPRHGRLLLLRNATNLLEKERRELLENSASPDATPLSTV
jgi:hypothetical protein